MKKVKIVALVLAFALILSGCSLFRVDEDLVMSQVVARVNGTPITRQQVETATKGNQSFLYEMYYYGITEEDLKEDENIKQWYLNYLNSSLDMLVENELLRQKALELGITLTEEEMQEKREYADDEFEMIKEEMRAEVKADFGITDTDDDAEDEGTEPEESTAPTPSVTESPAPAVDEAVIEAEVEKRYQEYITDTGLSPDKYYEMLCNQLLCDKVTEYVKGLAEVTDDEVKQWYDDTLALQQKEMDEDPTLFASKMEQKLICTYVPEDTIAVKQVLIKFKDQDVAEVAQELYNGGKKEEAMKLLEAEIAALTPQMQEIKSKLEAGEDIDKLIEEFGEDEGMTSGTAATIGYLVGESTTTYLEEFKNAALKLAEGKVSEPVATYYGLHILKNIKTYKKGIIPFETLKDSIKTALLPGKQDKKYEETLEQWMSEANITYDRARLEN